MSLAKADLGLLANLAEALGLFSGGAPNADWLAHPETYLKRMLRNAAQRDALIGFVDEALGGAERSTSNGVVWLPIVEAGALRVAVTLDAQQPDGVHVGIGLEVRTHAPASTSRLAVPLFRADRDGAASSGSLLLLGAAGGRIRLGSDVTLGAGAPGAVRLDAIGLELDVPTAPGDAAPGFALLLRGLQLPGAAQPRDVRIAADAADELDDAVLEFVLALLKSRADAAGANAALAGFAGLLGLRAGDGVPDFPLAAVAGRGAAALADWLRGVLSDAAARADWLGHAAALLGGTRVGNEVQLALGGSAVALSLAVDAGPDGGVRLAPQLSVRFGNADTRVQATAQLCRIDLAGGTALALPSLALWAATGRAAQPVLDLPAAGPTPAVRAETLRVGFALDAARKPTFVLAADTVKIGAREYDSLDLASPDALMDAAGAAAGDIAAGLLGALGGALPAVQKLLGLAPPPGVAAVSLPALATDPLAAVRGYWQALLGVPAAAADVLGTLREALADVSQSAAAVLGAGTPADPWRLPLADALALEAAFDAGVLSVSLAAKTSVDTLGQRCTVVTTRLAATLARLDFTARRAELLPSAEASLLARERGVDPPQAVLAFDEATELLADHVGLSLGWSAAGGLRVALSAPNPRLRFDGETVALAVPTIGADGRVDLPPPAWDGVQLLIGRLAALGSLQRSFVGELVAAFGWNAPEFEPGRGDETHAVLRLAELLDDPAAALRAWLPKLLLDHIGPRAFALVADLFGGSGARRAMFRGRGHPDDPWRIVLADDLPQLAVWFPPAGPAPRLVAAPQALRDWRPGQPALPFDVLEAALLAEAEVADDVADLLRMRVPLLPGLDALVLRWAGSDGRIAPPAAPPAGIDIATIGLGAGQLWPHLDLADATGRTPATVVHVALGAEAWPDAPAGRRVDLTAVGLAPEMLALPAAATGEWFVALGRRAECRPAGAPGDGHAEQAERLRSWLAALTAVDAQLAVVAVAGAGHAARAAADAVTGVADLVLLGTPLAALSLTALDTQPTADALRLLHRLLPPPDAGDDEPEDNDLALGRALVGALMELAPLADAGADLRLPAAALPLPRAGLAVSALFGSVDAEQVRAAITAIVAAGLALRARTRVAERIDAARPSGVQAGLHWMLPARAGGLLAIEGSADLALLAADLGGATTAQRVLRVRLSVADRSGWLTATPTLALRAASLDLTLPLDGASSGACRLTLHDALAFGQSWERLRIGALPGLAVDAVLPEARVLVSALVQRLVADVGGASSVALADVLQALGLVAAEGGVVASALEQLIHDPGGLLRERLAAAGGDLAAALAALLGPLALDIDFAARSVRLQGGDAARGRFGWDADVSVSPAGVAGRLHIGPADELQLRVSLQPFAASLHWRDDTAALWPAPDAQALARMLARAAPALAAHAALELLRSADEAARPTIDALLDALGFLHGAAGDAGRALKPLAPLLRDPARWFAEAASAPRLQALLDALRPLMQRPGAAGEALALTTGTTLSVAPHGDGVRLQLALDASAWTAPAGVASRLGTGVIAGLQLRAGAVAQPSLHVHAGVGLTPEGRQAVHATLGPAGLAVFLRPASGPDIALVPFAGLGSLAGNAVQALPFLLDRLAARPAPVGPLVAALGDALQLRAGAPAAFDIARLRAWAAHPSESLRDAAASIGNAMLDTLAPRVAALVPAGVNVASAGGELKVAIGAFSAAWRPAERRVSLAAVELAVPGIQRLDFSVALDSDGLRELRASVGPAELDAGGVVLRPFASVAAGTAPAGGVRVLVGLSTGGDARVALRWRPGGFDLVASDGLLDDADPVAVARRLAEALVDIAAAVALAQPAVDALLDQAVSPTMSVRNLLRGVLLADTADPDALIAQPFDAAALPARVKRLVANLASAGAGVTLDALTLRFADAAGTLGLKASLTQRQQVLDSDVQLWIENDDSWITPNEPGDGGLFVGFIDAGLTSFTPKLVVDGLGLRIGRASGPLLDAGIAIESVALHVFASIGAGGVDGAGVQLQFANLAVSASGVGGSNAIAQGILRDTGPTPPRPAFSPALAVQQHGSGGVAVSLRAGTPPGPWWVAVQKGFGPLYVEQVGFDARMLADGRLERVSLLLDGKVAMFGLSCAVDDLQITYFTTDGDPFEAANWKADLAGLAVSADIAGVSLAGGLLKQVSNAGTAQQSIEYLGMLLGRFAVYGLTVYGGYGEGVDTGGTRFTSFFAVGAINGPIGGPPAFFVTGVGGGFGINRRLVLPTDLSTFGNYPLIQALDIAAKPVEPMQQLRQLRDYFPMQRGTFWFAGGLSFTSFALVDGIAVVGVQVGDGLDVNLLGLARMALPRPQVALVSIEIALVARVSSREGVVWVQGQLTDNSWLLYPDIKLTGGFAYVIWFKGEHAGEFVLTLGGYHPTFSRPGYPQVPRLGMRWSIGSNIVIKAGVYFALTSEALMAGGDFECSATLGPGWAEVKFGAHGIVYFDPFYYRVDAYARIAAGVTIDTWLFGEVTFSLSKGCRLMVEGPDFRGRVTFEVGPVELTFGFGGSDRAQKTTIPADAFIAKYLEAGDGGALAHALITSAGALPAKAESATPDGSSQRPFVVVVEFSMILTSTVPAQHVRRVQPKAGEPLLTSHDPGKALGVAPMGASDVHPEIALEWRLRGGATQPLPFAVRPRAFGAFPLGVWGPPQDINNRKVPKAEMVEALHELELVCEATASGGGPEIPYHQVEIGPRKPLPFSRSAGSIAELRTTAQSIAALLGEPATVDDAFGTALRFLARSATPTALAALRGERQAPPRIGTLAEGLEAPTSTVVPAVGAKTAPKVYDHVVDAPLAVGLLGASAAASVAPRARTSVRDSARAWRVAPPTLASVTAERSRSIAARLVVAEAPAAGAGPSGARAVRAMRAITLIGAAEVPPTAQAQAPVALVARSGAALAEPLQAFERALVERSRGAAGAALAPGQVAVLKLPNAQADAASAGTRPRLAVAGAALRVVLLGLGGARLADRLVGADVGTNSRAEPIEIPQGCERIVAIGLGAPRDATALAAPAGLLGWHAGLRMPYVGHGSAIAPGCVVRSSTDRLALHRERADAGWVHGAELAQGETTVVTTFAEPLRTVLIALDDPAAAGRALDGRRLVLAIDGAVRARDASGHDKPPALLTMDNRSVLAYEVVPDASSRVPQPVVVTVASQQGWSLVAVMGSAAVDARSALVLAARGLDAALLPLAPADATGDARIAWVGPVRTPEQRRAAHARAAGVAVARAPRPLSAAAPARKTTRRR
ncbi:DUF6603 domain-containing protein [Caldimonas sp. KR1-144]|uniref:DUF6603 domain-containing protein n=1 Tax=Caldimonas sp. KR1-144 TaxID=3400911 RepID=UPI003C0F72DC